MIDDEPSDVGDANDDQAQPRRTSRRDVLRTAAAGAALTAGGIVLPSAAAATSGPGSPTAKGATAFAFVGRIDQDGSDFRGYAYLTEVAGVPDEALFDGQIDRSEEVAQLTIAGDVTLERRSILGNVFVLDAVGSLAIRLLDIPGADFADPASFTAGAVVARYSATLHDVLTVIGPNEGIPTLSGELDQTTAADFTLAGKRYRIGSRGTRLILDGTGHGVRTDPDAPRSNIDLAATVTFA